MSAPSFPSFSPVFDSFPDLEPSLSSQLQSAQGPESAKHDKHRDKKHSAEKERKTERSKDRRRERDKRDNNKERRHDHDTTRAGHNEHVRSSKHRKTCSTSIDDEDQGREARVVTAPESYNRFFHIDRKGDELNVKYGSLHVGDVPRYWHVGRGKKVLGLEPHLGVLYRGNKGVEIGEQGWYNKSPRLTDPRARALLASRQPRRLTVSAKAVLRYDEIDGFIRVPSRKGKERDQANRSIAFGGEDDSNSDSSSLHSVGEASGDDSDTSPMSAREESLRSLEQRLTKDPTSVSTWLLLLQHSVSGIESSSKNVEKACAEISVSILERAMSAHPTNARSPLLRLKYLKAGEIVWDIVRMQEEWDRTLKTIGSADMHVEWFDWAIRATPSFNAAVEYAVKAVGLVHNNISDENADYAKLRIFWRTATIFKQAGHVERGFALFQAQAELSFNVPEENRNCPFEQRLDLLEEFWESEAPRVGETGARGWKAWRTDKEGGAGRRPCRIGEHGGHDPYAIWLFGELESDKHLVFPARMQENGVSEDVAGEEEDPYAAVLFSDIRPFLTDLRTVNGREMFRLIWLSYLGLHIPGLSSALSPTNLASDDRWADTVFLQPWFVRSLFPQSTDLRMITADSCNGVMVGREKKYVKSFDAIKSWSLGVLAPLEGLTVNGEYRMWGRDCLLGVDPDVTEVMRRIFRELRHDKDFLGWSVAELAFEASTRGESALKLSQAMLAENSSSAELLASHAYLERIRRRYEKARKVYRVGLQSLAQSGKASVVCLWWGSAELEWLLSNSDAALEIVVRATGQQNERTGVHILRAKRRLEELCQLSAVPDWKFRFKWIRLRALLELLVGTLDTAIEVWEGFIACEEARSLRHESITVAALLMLYHHTVTLRNPAPPVVLRDRVRNALDIYPSNSIVIGLFLECEKGESVWGRVRTLMRESVPGALQDKSVARRLIEVWIAKWEEGRWLGEVERVRAGLEAAVTSDRTKGSAVLWKVYVRFEVAAGNVKRAKAVLFRALQECPLVKELYLLAFEEDLRQGYSRQELMDLSDTMAERGIRLRHSLGEVLEIYGDDGDKGESGSEKGGEGDEPEDEQEYDSRELRRLMPY